MPFNLSSLFQLHADCLSTAVDVENSLLIGRPYGGTGIYCTNGVMLILSVLLIPKNLV